MKQLEVGMHVTTQDQQTYRIIAVVNHGQQFLVQPEEMAGTVQLIKATEIVQVTEQSPTDLADVALDTVTVVGQHYVTGIKATMAQLAVGEVVLLQRESDNQYDENAISVWSAEHAKLGYVARYQNQPYAELLDQSQPLYGIVDQLDAKKARLSIMIWRTTSQASPIAAMRIRQRLTPAKATLTTLPQHLLNTPLGNVIMTCNGRPIAYQQVPLTPWLSPTDELFVSQRYLLTPDWSRIPANSLVTCQVSATAQVVQRWQTPTTTAVVLTNATSFYVVGIGAQTMTGLNDNLAAESSEPTAFYRIGQTAPHRQAGFIVSWAAFGEPGVQPALLAAMRFPNQPVVPYLPLTADQNHATFTRQELAALLVSPLPNYQGGQILEPSVSDLTTEKLRVTLGDQAYHALAKYQQRVQLANGSVDDVNTTLLQALIHAVIYHEIATLNYYQPTVGMVMAAVYPIQLFSANAKDDDADKDQLIGCLAFYNYDTFELEQVPVSAIASVAVIADPEHPQTSDNPPNPDWRQIFLHSWND